MKKIIKYLSISLLIVLLVTTFTYRNRILLLINIISKYSSTSDSLESLSSLAVMSNIDFLDENEYDTVTFKDTNNTPLTLDIYPSKKDTSAPSPVLMYVHGGSWIYGVDSIPQSLSPLLDIFREEGYTIVSVCYEINPNDINFEKQISDVKDAIRWVHKNKDEYNLNSNEIGLFGISSGAHLALMAAYSNNNEFVDDESLASYPSEVKYILDCFGPTNLSTLDPTNLGGHLAEVFNSIDNKDEVSKQYSPINYIKENLPPTLIIHSKADTLVPYSNSESLYYKSKSFGNKVDLVSLENMQHDLTNFNEEDENKIAFNILKFIVINSPLG